MTGLQLSPATVDEGSVPASSTNFDRKEGFRMTLGPKDPSKQPHRCKSFGLLGGSQC